MRPVAKSQNRLKYPLNVVFGRESHVRILRLISDQTEPVGVTFIAQKVGLTKTGARKAINILLKSGIVQEFGVERRRQYSLCARDDLSRAIVALFESERRKYGQLLDAIRARIERLDVFPHSVWLQNGPRGNDNVVKLGFWSTVRDIERINREFRRLLYDIESEFNVTIELEGFTDAELPFLSAENVHVMYGRMPENVTSSQQSPLSHKQLDDRARIRAHRTAEFIRNDPMLRSKAERWLEDRISGGTGTSTGDLEEWLKILKTYSKQQLRQFLVSESPRSRRLRQSSPFPAVLDPDQKSRLM